jgi:hypothetical protein
MADALKRISKTKDQAFQDRCTYYMYQKAAVVFSETTPDADDLLLAKALWAGQVSMQDIAKIVVTNFDIGGSIDAGNEVAESAIEWMIFSDDVGAKGFHQLALAYKSAGKLGA